MFGQTPAAAPAASTSFGFGANSTSSAPKATFSFGAPAQASTSAAPAPSFGFGATSTAQPQAGQAQPSGGGLFGQQPAQQGQQGQPQQGGLFGQQQQQQPAQGAQGGTSLFGQPQSQAAQGGGLFGQPAQGQGQGQAQAQPAGSLFGQTQPQGQTQGSSLFGNPATGSFGTFGAASTAQPSTGLFGSTAAASQSKPSVFGAQPSAPPGGLFGSTAGQSSIFGQPQQQQQQQPQQQGSLFGQSTSQPFGQAQPPAFGLGQSQAQQLVQSVGPNAALVQNTLRQKSIEERLQEVQAGWDTNNPNCRLKHFFYNQVAPGTASQYGRPPNASDALWKKAKNSNPDETRFVPTLVVGFEDVKKRAAAQKKEAEGQYRRISELSTKLDQLSRANTSRAALRLAAMQNTLAQLQKRLIALIARVPGFVEPATGAANQQLDNSTRARLLEIKGDLEGKRAGASAQMAQGLTYSARGPGTPTGRRAGTGTAEDRAQTQRLMGQVNELWGAVEELRRRKAFGTGRNNGDRDGKDGWLADEKALAEVANILGQHQLALHKLTEMLDEAQFDVNLIKEAVKRG